MPHMNVVGPISEDTWLFKCPECHKRYYRQIYNDYCYCDFHHSNPQWNKLFRSFSL